MDRKEACEQIILLPKEKRLLKRIRRSRRSGVKCDKADVQVLIEYGLEVPLCSPYEGFGLPVPNGLYVVSDFYAVYAAYCHRELLDYLADKWVDILASVISLISLTISIAALLQVPPA